MDALEWAITYRWELSSTDLAFQHNQTNSKQPENQPESKDDYVSRGEVEGRRFGEEISATLILGDEEVIAKRFRSAIEEFGGILRGVTHGIQEEKDGGEMR